jgi:hypothetical protein
MSLLTTSSGSREGPKLKSEAMLRRGVSRRLQPELVPHS